MAHLLVIEWKAPQNRWKVQKFERVRINQVLIPSPMFLFCFTHGKFTLISHNSALPALVSLIQNLVEIFLKTAKILQSWFYVKEVKE